MEQKKGVDKFIVVWNNFIKNLIELEKDWKTLSEFRIKYELSIEDLPDDCQKHLSRVNLKARFAVGIVRFVEFIERCGDFEDCIIKKKGGKK